MKAGGAAGKIIRNERMWSHAYLSLIHIFIAANSLREPGAGFGTSTNILTLITRDTVTPLPMLSKDAAAYRLLDEILRCRTAK